jgi:hypothetical protein
LLQKLHGKFPPQQDTVALAYHQKAMGATIEMMQDPFRRMSDETLGAIASFMCHFVSAHIVGSGNN